MYTDYIILKEFLLYSTFRIIFRSREETGIFIKVKRDITCTPNANKSLLCYVGEEHDVPKTGYNLWDNRKRLNAGCYLLLLADLSHKCRRNGI